MILSLADYEAMVEALEDIEDREAVIEYKIAKSSNPNLKLTPISELEH